MARLPSCWAMLATIVSTALLGGCGATGPTSSANFVYAFSDRYPLIGTRVDRLDVAAFQPAGNDIARLARFARDYRLSGRGKVVIFVPQTGPQALASGNWVRQELIAQGVSPNKIQWDARSMPAGTVRVAFAGNAGSPQWDCNNLQEDIQQQRDQTSYLNREYVNFGCAYQSNMRAQLDNPHDLVTPRAETAMDPVRVSNAVRRVRSGSAGGNSDPGSIGRTP